MLATTDVPINDLRPGNQLNALVCLHVFEWKEVPLLEADDHGIRQFATNGINQHGRACEVPAFSDSSAYTQLIAKLEKCFVSVTVHYNRRRWKAWVNTKPSEPPDGDARAIAVAISRAALKWRLGSEYVKLPLSRTREWKANVRDHVEKVQERGPTPIRTQVVDSSGVKRGVARLRAIPGKRKQGGSSDAAD